MAKAKNSYERMAADAAKRIEDARDMGQQLTFLGDEAGAPPVDTVERQIGRPKGAKNKGSSELRKWLAAQGYRMPEDMLAEMAGLSSRDPAIVVAMQQTEQVLTWAYQGAKDKDGVLQLPSPAQRVQMFNSIYTILLRAADALLPYAAAKASPDVQVNDNRTFIVPAAPSAQQDGHGARVINGSVAHEMAPADVRHKRQQKQYLSKTDPDDPDAESRTE